MRYFWFFLLTLLLIALLGWGTNQIKQPEPASPEKPLSNPSLAAKSAISVLLKDDGQEKVLFKKNSDQKLPVASLTKLMTAKIALERYESSETRDSLYLMLISSDNQSATDLAAKMGEAKFVDLMNQEAQILGLTNTHFINPNGLDGIDNFNYSTARDLAKLAKNILLTEPLIWDISLMPEFGNATNTNELLGIIPNIIGGKTGETPKAGQCLLLILKTPEGYLINVILNSRDRFGEMKKLIQWSKKYY